MSVFIIAEAGINHDGSFRKALELVDAAKEAGADAVKFQLFDSERLRRPQLKEYELHPAQMKDIKAYCKASGIEYVCTPFDIQSLDTLVALGVRRLKISSGCIKNRDLLYAAYQTGLPIILSTGMSSLSEVRSALGLLHEHVTLLHCTSAYPCPIEAVNLRAMDELRTTFERPVGYSDHTLGITVSLAAVARGACMIEKHLTLDRKSKGPDHKASIEPDEFRVLVRGIRTVEEALGNGIKMPQPCEMALKAIWHGH